MPGGRVRRRPPVPLIDWDRLGEPRIFCGYSDPTALHLALAKHGPWTTFYGPMFTRFTRKKDGLTEVTEDCFHRAFKAEPLGRVPEDPDDPYVLTVNGGVAEGPIVGGCLTLVAASLGTPYEIETDGCIVLLEDLNEEPYIIDSHLNHLILAGKLENAAGLVFGTDVNLKPLRRSRSTSSRASRSRRSSTS